MDARLLGLQRWRLPLNAGFWGPTVGYYGGINYGFGYFGVGFYGGYWNHGAFFYNREYNHFGAGFRSDHFYSQHYGNFDGRPGGTSFASGHFDGNRGGSFINAGNAATNRNGFGQNGARSTFASAAPYRGGYNSNQGSTFNNGGTGNNINHGTTFNGGNTFNRGTMNGGFGQGSTQNTARSTMASAAPYRGGFNQPSPVNNPYAGNRGGYRQPTQVRQPSPFQGNAGRPSSGSSFHAPSSSAHANSGSGNLHGGSSSHGGHR